MTPDRPDQLIDTLSAPLGDLIAEVGRSVAEAQRAMDAATIENVRALATASPGDPQALLRQIGYQPTWYQIPEVTAELTVALTLSGSGESKGASPRARMLAAPVDATYASRFNYELKAASSVKFRIVPVPPSPAAERLRVAPVVVGLTFAAARERLGELDIRWAVADGQSPEDATAVTAQQPAAGEFVTGAVTLGFA